MRRPPAALRHITAHRLAFTAVALTVLVTTVCAAAAASFATTVTGSAITGRSLAGDKGNSILVGAQTSTGDAAHVGAIITSTIASAASGLPVSFSASLRSQFLNLPAGGPGGSHAQVQIVSLPALADHAMLVGGSWPAGTAAGPVPTCLPASAARQLRLSVGQTLTLRDAISAAPVTIGVSCVFREDRADSTYWSLSPLGPAGLKRAGGFSVYGPMVTSPAIMAGRRLPVIAGAWLAVPDFRRLGALSLTDLSNRVSAASGALLNSSTLSVTGVTTALPALLSSLATAVVVSRSQLVIGILILLVAAGAALAVTVRLLAMQRDAEAALLAARGASRWQLAARAITDVLLLAVPAGLAGPFIGGGLITVLTRSGPLAVLHLRPGQPLSAWLAAAAAAAGCAIVIALPWLRTPPSPVAQRTQRGRQAAIGAIISAGADLALVALAAIAGWQLAHYTAPVTTGISGSLGIDPILVSAPVPALAAGTLLTLRLLPLAARLADRAAAGGRGITVPVAAWQISRRPLRQAGPALLAVLAVAIVVITLAQTSSWQRSVQSQARFAVGADFRITLPAAGALAVGQVAAITAARGVLASTPAVRAAISMPQGGLGTMLALNTRTAVFRSALRAGQPDASAAQLRGLAPAVRQPGTLVPGRPARLRVTASLRGRGIAAPALSVQLTDAAGVSYAVPAGTLPADGHGHELTAIISALHRADYPLRLTGYIIQYTQAADRPAPGILGITSVAAAAALRGPFGGAFPAAPSTGRAALAVPGGQRINAPTNARVRAIRGALDVSFVTGTTGGKAPSPASLSVAAGPAVSVLPALATRSFLAASGTQLGSTALIVVQGASLPVRLVAQVRRFPTVTGPAGGVLVDQRELQDALRTRGVAPAPVTEWWLNAARRPALPGLPAGTSVVGRAALARSLSNLPLSAAPLQALLAIAAAAVLLACGGFVVSVATGTERQRDVALLDALGAPSGDIVRLLCLEQTMLAVPAAAAGLALGALLSYLIIPAVSLTAQAAHPDPPVVVQVPWTLAIGTAAVIAMVPAVATALAATRRMAAAARLRAEEEK
jgi:FtsX-like permease family